MGLRRRRHQQPAAEIDRRGRVRDFELAGRSDVGDDAVVEADVHQLAVRQPGRTQ